MTTQNVKKGRPHGFALLVVLFIVAAGMAMASAMLQSTPAKVQAASAKNSEVVARSVSEACLERAFNFVRHEVNVYGAADFDHLLDPGANAPGSYDINMFIPGPTSDPVVYVPPGATANAEMRAQHAYRYTYDAAREGACLIRFDDNQDDFFVSNGLSTGPDEGGGVDVQRRDRDRSIVVTAIGIYPVRAGTAADDAYGQAKSRVTTRGVLQTEVQGSVAAGAGLHATGEIRVSGGGGSTSLAVCGASAGAIYNSVDTGDEDRVCTCGDDNTSGTNIGACSGVCSSASEGCGPYNDVNFPVTVPGTPVPVPPTFRIDDVTGFDRATVYGAAGPENGVCSFFFQRAFAPGGGGTSTTSPLSGADTDPGNLITDMMVYVWDYAAVDPWATGPKLLTPPTTFVSNGVPAPGTPGVFASCNAPQGPTVPAPCEWYPDLPASAANDVTTSTFTRCAPTQSPCWVPIALLDSITQSPGPFFANEPTQGTGPGGFEEFFHPKNEQTMNLYSSALPVRFDTFCGPRNDNTTNLGFAWDHANPTPEDNTWSVRGAMDGEDWPDRGVVLIFNEAVDNVGTQPSVPYSMRFNGRYGTTNRPMQMTIASTGGLRFDEEVETCCPTCNCNINSINSSNECEAASPAARNSNSAPALVSGGWCVFEDDQERVIEGNVQCGAVQVEEDLDCLVGDLTATVYCENGLCNGAANLQQRLPNLPAGDNFCFVNSGPHAQDPGICIGRSGWGGGWSDRAYINGNIISRGDVVLRNRVSVFQDSAPPSPPRYIIANDDFEIGRRISVYAEVFVGGGADLPLSPAPSTPNDITFFNQRNTIYGRAVVNGNVEVLDRRNKIVWNGDNGIQSVDVSADAMWYESTW